MTMLWRGVALFLLLVPAAAATPTTRSPLATPDELRVERLAERLAAAPQVRAAAANIETQWRAKLTAKLGTLSAQSEAALGPSIDELAYAYAQKTANSDPARPRVSWIESPPHHWFGDDVPGGRYAGDNPDTIYRIVPIDGVSSYEVTGQFLPNRPATTLFQVVTDVNLLTTVSQLDGNNMVVRPDGTFTITVNPTTGTGEGNHLQTKPGVVQLFIRDTLSDWNTQTPPRLTVRRIAGPPAPAPKTFDDLVTDTLNALHAQNWIDFFILGLQFAPPVNTLSPPLLTANTARSFGNYHLDDDHALVITANPADAPYFAITMQNDWTITPAYWNHQTSLTNDQAMPNTDGTYTFVVSTRDPGIANWIDTTGLRDGTLFARWQGLPGAAMPTISARFVSLSDLDTALPPDTARVTPSQRAAQLARRQSGFERRIAAPDTMTSGD